MDKLEAILASHSEVLESSWFSYHAVSRAGTLFRGRNASFPGDQGTPREPSHMYAPAEPTPVEHAPRPSAFTPTSQGTDCGAPSAPALHRSLRSQMQSSAVSSPLQLPPIQTAMTAHDGFVPAQPGEASCIGIPLPRATSPANDPDMPPYDLHTLVDLYFKHINTWCQILHSRTTLELLFGPVAIHEADRILLHAIVATAMRYCTDPRLTRE